MRVIIRTTEERAKLLAHIVSDESKYAVGQLDRSPGMATLLESATVDLLSDIYGYEPDEIIMQEDLASYPENGRGQVRNGKPHIRKTASYRKAVVALSDGAWRFCDQLHEHGIPKGTINGLMARMVEAGIVETQGKRFRKQYRLAAGVTL